MNKDLNLTKQAENATEENNATFNKRSNCKATGHKITTFTF